MPWFYHRLVTSGAIGVSSLVQEAGVDMGRVTATDELLKLHLLIALGNVRGREKTIEVEATLMKYRLSLADVRHNWNSLQPEERAKYEYQV